MTIDIQKDKSVAEEEAQEFQKFSVQFDPVLLQNMTWRLTQEARLLDMQAYRTWLEDYVAPDIQYQVISRELRAANERRYQLNDAVNIFNENYVQLKVRVEHQLDPQNWAGSPRIRFTRFVSNVMAVKDSVNENMVDVRSSVILHRARRGNQVDVFYASRQDKWKRAQSGQYQLVRRVIDYPERVLQTHNLMVFL